MEKIEKKKIQQLFNRFKKLKVFVIGDAMLDCYWKGSIDRISPEAPVPVFSVSSKTEKLGGAGNVALNCVALGAQVSLFTVLGHDKDGKTLLQLLQNQGIDTDGCLLSKSRVTTSKSRLMSKNQQVIRIDEEVTDPLSTKDEHAFIETCLKAIQIDVPDIIIFEDYNKGILLPNVIEKITAHAKMFKTLIAVDPKKDNFFSYQGVDIFKPNLKEVKEAFGENELVPNTKSLKNIHQRLKSKLNHKATLITLSELGIFAMEASQSISLPAHLRNITDVSGAGDTVISVASMVYRVSKDLQLATQAANLAGGLVCEEVGVVPISKEKLFEELT